MKSPLLILLAFFLASSCTPKTLGPAPVDVEKMATVLTDLQLAEALKAEIPAALRDSMQLVYEDKVLADHDFTRASFDSLMWIVRKEPEWVLEVFTLVNDKLARMNAEEQRIPEDVQEEKN